MLMSSYCDVWFAVDLLQRGVFRCFSLLQCFICVGDIQTSKADSMSRRYQIMFVNMLKILNKIF